MNIEQIRALAEIVDIHRLTGLEITEGDLHIRLEKAETIAVAAPPPVQAGPAQPIAASADLVAPVETAAGVDFNNITEVKAPMVGVFYEAPSPGAEPYVKRGSRVKRGDVLCIIEAMKLLNEIVAETDGEIADICAQNGEVVEYGQTLFKVY